MLIAVGGVVVLIGQAVSQPHLLFLR
jgi:hypothetical protein